MLWFGKVNQIVGIQALIYAHQLPHIVLNAKITLLHFSDTCNLRCFSNPAQKTNSGSRSPRVVSDHMRIIIARSCGLAIFAKSMIDEVYEALSSLWIFSCKRAVQQITQTHQIAVSNVRDPDPSGPRVDGTTAVKLPLSGFTKRPIGLLVAIKVTSGRCARIERNPN